MIKLAKNTGRRLVTYIKVRAVVLEYRLAKQFWQSKAVQLDLRRIELENRLKAVSAKEAEIEVLLKEMKQWYQTQMLNSNRIHHFEERAENVQKALHAVGRGVSATMIQ